MLEHPVAGEEMTLGEWKEKFNFPKSPHLPCPPPDVAADVLWPVFFGRNFRDDAGVCVREVESIKCVRWMI